MLGTIGKLMTKIICLICVLITVFSILSMVPTVVAAPKISTPKSISVSNISTGIKVEWSKVKSAKGYFVYRKKYDSYKFTRIAKVSKGNKIKYIDKNAVSGNYYIYAVKAYNSSSTSSYKKSSKKIILAGFILNL